MEQVMQVGAIATSLGLLWLTLQALRRFRVAKTTTPAIQIRQRVSLDNRCQLVVVHWDGKDLLLAAGTQGCTVVATRAIPLAPPMAETRGAWAQ
jgi:flagellar biogenesis protein FliO